MADVEKSPLVFPFEAQYVDAALAMGREDQERLRKEEVSWLQENSSYLYALFCGDFAKVIELSGIDTGNAYWAGRAMGNRAIRLFLDDHTELDYEALATQYRANVEVDNRRLGDRENPTRVVPWKSHEILTDLFGDERIAGALTKVRHETARETAAITIAFYCLSDIPESAYANV